jgi:hypothetical protein
MAATSQAGRECAGRDANLRALRRAFDRRDGLALRVHQDRYRSAANTGGRLGRTVAGAWVGRGVARWVVGRYRAWCQEAVRDCRWALVVEELEFVRGRQAPPQDVRKQGACRAGRDDLLDELPDVLPRAVLREHLAA